MAHWSGLVITLLGVVAAAALAAAVAFGAWLGSSMGQAREDIVQLRGAAAHNTSSIRRIEARLDSMDARLDDMQVSLAVLVERSGGEATPRQ
ncbi:MAG: hypothetical protein OXU53_05385 [Deltaproteobacteria bacterium]|nr:hypothetical protein [Deltaproteobacteria bacterium]